MSKYENEFEAVFKEKALYRMGSSDYHKLKYVRWLEARLQKAESPADSSLAPCNSDYAAALEKAFWAGCGYGAGGGIEFNGAAKEYVKRLNSEEPNCA